MAPCLAHPRYTSVGHSWWPTTKIVLNERQLKPFANLSTSANTLTLKGISSLFFKILFQRRLLFYRLENSNKLRREHCINTTPWRLEQLSEGGTSSRRGSKTTSNYEPYNRWASGRLSFVDFLPVCKRKNTLFLSLFIEIVCVQDAHG